VGRISILQQVSSRYFIAFLKIKSDLFVNIDNFFTNYPDLHVKVLTIADQSTILKTNLGDCALCPLKNNCILQLPAAKSQSATGKQAFAFRALSCSYILRRGNSQ